MRRPLAGALFGAGHVFHHEAAFVVELANADAEPWEPGALRGAGVAMELPVIASRGRWRTHVHFGEDGTLRLHDRRGGDPIEIGYGTPGLGGCAVLRRAADGRVVVQLPGR